MFENQELSSAFDCLVLLQVIMQRLNKDNNALRGTHHSGDVYFTFFFKCSNFKYYSTYNPSPYSKETKIINHSNISEDCLSVKCEGGGGGRGG